MEDNKAEQHDAPSKSKEEIQAERKAKKAEKAAKKTSKQLVGVNNCLINID